MTWPNSSSEIKALSGSALTSQSHYSRGVIIVVIINRDNGGLKKTHDNQRKAAKVSSGARY